MTITTAETPDAAGVREIPRLCECKWRMLFRAARPAGWKRAVTSPDCPLHRPGRTGGR